MHTIRYYPYEAGRTLYPIDFALGFLSREHVYVYVGDDPLVQVDYTWVNDGQVSLATPISVGQELKIQRRVPTELFNDYENGSRLSHKNLDTSFLQALMLHEEVLDGFLGDTFRIQSNDVILRNLEVLGKTVVQTPVEDDEATTKLYVDVAVDSLKEHVDTEDADIRQFIADTVETAILNGFGSNYVGETPPVFLRSGIRWYKPSEFTTYVYYCDDDSCQWVQEPVQSAEGTLRQELAATDSSVLVGGVEAGDIGASFDTLSDALAASIKLGARVSINEREVGLKGLSDWAVVANNSPNSIDKVQMTSDPTKMLQLILTGSVVLDQLGAGNGGDDVAILNRAGELGTVICGNPEKTLQLGAGVVTFANNVQLDNIKTQSGTILFRKDAKGRHCNFVHTFIRHRSANDLDYVSANFYRSTFTANTAISDNISIWGGDDVRYDNCIFDGSSLRHMKVLPLFSDVLTGASLTKNLRIKNSKFKGTAVRQLIDAYSGGTDILLDGNTVEAEAETFFEHKLKGDSGNPFQTKHTNIRAVNNKIKLNGAACIGVYVIQGAYGAAGTTATTFQSFKSLNDEIEVGIINNSSAPIDVRGFNYVEIKSQVKHLNSNTHPSIQLGSNEVAKVIGGYYDGHIDASAVSYSGQTSSPGYTLLGKQLSVLSATVRDYKAVAGVNSETYETVRVLGCDIGTVLTSGASAVVVRNATNVFCTDNTHPLLGTNRLNIVGSPTLVVNRDNSWALPIRSGDSSFTYNGEWFYNTTASAWSVKVAGSLVNIV